MSSQRCHRESFPPIVTAFAVLASLSVAGCAPGRSGRGDDKAGGTADPVVLRMANTSNSPNDRGLDHHPALLYFVNQVKQRSQGALRIDVVPGWGHQAPGAEQQVIGDVAAGTIELGWVGTSVFDTLGDTDFQALTAPMLIDSNPLQQAVLDSDIPAQMLAGLDELGVHGMAVLGDGLRKPIAVNGPLLRPADYQGITFSAFRSAEHAAAIQALGATPTDTGVGAGVLRDGAIDGFEKGLRIYDDNGYGYLAPFVTANVNLWPHTVALIANPDTIAGLTTTQRDWLIGAATDAASRSTDLTDDDAELLLRLCDEGSRFTDASADDLAAMRQAFAPEYTTLNSDPTTKAFIEQIEALKDTTGPGAGLDIPADCTGPAPTPPAQPSHAPTTAVGVATPLDGTYRWTITAADALTYGTPGDKTPENQATFPWIFTVTMNDGHWTMKHRQADGDFDDGEGTYTVQGDRVVLDSVGGIVDTFAFEVDGEGTLHLTGQGGSDPGDVFVMATNPWTKIAGGVAAPTSVDGTYRWTLTKDDALTHGLPGDRTPQAQATFPSVFTMTMDRGTWQLGNLDAQGVANSDAGHGSYSVEGDHVVFHEGVEVFDYTFSIDADGTVHLVAQPPINPGPAWVFTTNPWTKIT